MIISQFTGTPRDGHGHHQVAGIITQEAFKAAADPGRYPEYGKPWQAKKLYLGGGRGNDQIPQAALALKQGFGRLIRSRSDRGVLAMLDNRITKQRYGQVFFDSLPDYAFTTELEDVEKFFNV